MIMLNPNLNKNAENMLETHNFSFNQDLYGKRLRVALVEFIRPEKKFDGIEALREQICSDTGLVKKILHEMPKEFR